MKKAFLLLSLAAMFSSPLAAQEIDPGLWRVNTTVTGNEMGQQMRAMSQAMQMLENQSPEVRRMIEQQMGGMLGIDIQTRDGAPTVSMNVCISPEDAKSGPIQNGRTDGDCTYQDVKQQGNRWSGTLVCDGDGFQGTGQFTATIHSKQHYTSQATLQSPKMGTMELAMEGRLQAPACG
ncbi:DUF3617 domain-containing protein [Castellaniella sp.]|uniref:DUF3617 domain-containing protein n=1 Tax=Castellaniella sp. TaxID=1955812 RepID=UPI003561F884